MKSLLASMRPGRNELIDAAAVLALTSIALSGFHTAFGGWGFFTVGMVAALLGVLVAHVLHRAELPLVMSVVVAAAAFLLLSAPLVIADKAMFGMLPTPATVTGLIDGTVAGWKRLLTTLPPSGSFGNLLAVPYLLGFVGGLTGTAMSRDRRRLAALLVVPGATLVLSLLFGTRSPFSVLVQGSLFAAVSIGWLAARKARDHKRYLQASGHKRLFAGAVMLVVVGVAGTALADHMPLAGTNPRFVLRDRTEPPFDPRQFGSPLSTFQKFLIGDKLKNETLFTIEGLPDTATDSDGKVFIRLAVMDDYDGVVWRVSPGGNGSTGERSGKFVRIGADVPMDADAPTTEMSVAVRRLPGFWVPDVGEFGGIEWTGERAPQQRDAFRLSLLTSTGILPLRGGWQAGDSYRFRAVVESQPTARDLGDQGVDLQVTTALTAAPPDDLVALASTITKGKATVYQQAAALQSFFKSGYYASGDVDAAQGNAPGHSYARLQRFLQDGQPVGNGEQYAAAMAVLARSIGIPARVVMGFRLDVGSTEVKGKDVYAWVEIGFDSGWVRFDVTPTRTDRPTVKRQTPQPFYESQDLPPPPAVPPPPELNARKGKEGASKAAKDDEPAGASEGVGILLIAGVVGLGGPLILFAGFAAVVLMLKSRRRSRRRGAALASNRVAGGFDEFMDAARDAGRPVAGMGTRRESALLVGASAARPLAAQADAAVFGPEEPSPQTVDEYWRQVANARTSLHASMSPLQRLRAHLSLTSLRRPR